MKHKLFTLFTAVLLSTSMWANCNITAVQDLTSSYEPTQIVNGSFEEQPWMSYFLNGNLYDSYDYKYWDWDWTEVDYSIPNGVNEGWNTTETHIQGGTLFEAGGGQAEMNAVNSAVLYQDLYTHGNDVIRWSLGHKARSDCGDEVQDMRVEVGAPNYSGDDIVYAHGVGDDIETEIKEATKVIYRSTGVTEVGSAHGNGEIDGNLKNLSVDQDSQNDQFYYASGIYVVPAGQNVTRFGFVSEDTDRPDCGNYLTGITFSTLVGDLSATSGEANSVIVQGYWGEDDTNKELVIEIGDQTLNVDMSGVVGENFKITIPHDCIGETVSSVAVYHEDYESAKTTLSINLQISVTATGVEKTVDGNAYGISVVTDPADCSIMYGTSNGEYNLTSSPTFSTVGNHPVYYIVSKSGYTTVKGVAYVNILPIMYNVTVASNNPEMGNTLMDDIIFASDFNSGYSLPDGWTTSGPAWSVSGGCLQSGSTGDYETSSLNAEVTITGSGSVSFRYRISSEDWCDFGYFYIDDETKFEVSGDGSWESALYELSAGTHTLSWRYSKDVSVAYGSDKFYIDDISITSLAPVGSSPLSIVEGSTINVIASPNSGYGFVNWTDGGDNVIGTNATLPLTVSSDIALTANFAHLWTVSYNGNGKTGGTVPTDNTQHLDGSSVTVLSSSLTKTGYTFAGWLNSVDGNTYGSDESFTITANTTLTAQWDVNTSISLNDDDAALPTLLAALNDGNARNLTFSRSLSRDGNYSTLCLPFSMNASQITASSLNGFVICELTDMWSVGNELRLLVTQTSTIVAGKPYIMRYGGEPTEAISPVEFPGVIVSASVGSSTSAEGATMYGILAPTSLDAGNRNYLFLMANNTLTWPNTSSKMKAFRAYFILDDNTSSGVPVRRGMPAKIVEQKDTQTGVENAESLDVHVQKILRDGQLIIIRNGVEYNVNGQIIK